MKNYTIKEAAEFFEVSPGIIRYWIRKQFFPNAVKSPAEGKRKWLIPESDLQNFTRGNKGRPVIKAPTPDLVFRRDLRARTAMKKSHGYGVTEFLEMIRLNKEGLSADEIAGRFDIPEKFVNFVIARAELKSFRMKKKREKAQLKRLPGEQLIDLYVQQKLPTSEILRLLNISYVTLYINLNYWKIPLRDSKAKKLADERSDLLRKLYIEDNLSFEELAARLNLQIPYIKRKLRQMGIKTNKRDTEQ